MKELRRQRLFKRIIYSKFTIVVVLIVIIFLGKAVFNMYKIVLESQVNKTKAEEALGALLSRRDFLNAEVTRLSTEKGIEIEIRKKFRVAKPGEELVVIIDDDGKEEASGSLAKKGIAGFFERFFSKWGIFK